MGKAGFTRTELSLVGTAALLVFSRVFGLSVVLPNFRTHYEGQFAVDPFWIGVAFSAYGLTMAVMQLPNGILSDRFGRRPLMVTASLLFIGGSVLAAFAVSPWQLITGRLVQGMGAVASVAVAAVGETLPASRRTMGMAMVGIPAGTGFLIGMASGPALYELVSMQGLFLLTGAIGLLAMLPLIRIQLPDRSTTIVPSRPLNPAVFSLALAGFASNFALTTTLFFLPDGATDWLPALMAAGFVSMLTLSRVIDKKGWNWQPLAIAAVGIGVSGAIFTQGAWLGFWVGGSLFFVFHSILATVLPSQVSRIAGPSGGRGHGIQNVIAYGGTFLAGPIAGALASQPNVAVSVSATIGVVAAAAIVVSIRTPQPSSVAPGEAASRE